MTPAIDVRNISKRFRRYRPDRPRTLQEVFLQGISGLRPEDSFWALREVNFSVERGKMLGVIGQNGAGKSTLLRVIGGVIRPDSGLVTLSGRVGALIDLGAGFHPDLSGKENVFINGMISGLTRREVLEQFDSIVAFAELEDFIDNPLRTYSTGMQLRLAFAVATHIHPEILLIDEILSVGDLAFQQKCLERITRFRLEGSAILVVTHDTNLVRNMCDEVIWLREGKIVTQGPPEKTVQQYISAIREATERRTPHTGEVTATKFGTELRLNENRFGSLEMQIVEVSLLTADGLPATDLQSGEPLRIGIRYHAPQPIESPIFSVSISKEDGFVCFDTSTAIAGLPLPDLSGTGAIHLNLERLDVVGGRYFVDVGVFRHDWAYAYDYHWHTYPIEVSPNREEKGILKPPINWELNEIRGYSDSLG